MPKNVNPVTVGAVLFVQQLQFGDSPDEFHCSTQFSSMQDDSSQNEQSEVGKTVFARAVWQRNRPNRLPLMPQNSMNRRLNLRLKGRVFSEWLFIFYHVAAVD